MDSAVLAAAIGVGGTVIVGVAGFWASVRNTSQTIADAQSSRLWEWRARAYADYGYAVKNLMALCTRIADHRGVGKGARGDIDLTKALIELGQLSAERTAKWESVLLIGSPETVEAAREWHRNVGHMELIARGIRTDPAEWKSVLEEFATARARFYGAARRDLDIRDSRIRSSALWQEPTALVGLGDGSQPSDR